MRKYTKDNAEHLSEYKREYEKSHKEWRMLYSKRYNETHVNEIRALKKKWNDKNRDHNYEIRKKYMFEYNHSHPRKKYPRKREMDIMHSKTADYIRKKWIRPTQCNICWAERRVISHHPNNDIWNEIVWCCDRCHRLIHSGYLECPKPIDLLSEENKNERITNCTNLWKVSLR